MKNHCLFATARLDEFSSTNCKHAKLRFLRSASIKGVAI